MNAWTWVIIGVVLLAVELTVVSAGFYLVLIGASALLLGLFLAVAPPLPSWVQWGCFAALVIISTLMFRARIYNRILGAAPRVRTGLAAGQTVTLPAALAPGDVCQAEYGGSFWTVRNEGRTLLRAGERVRIAYLQGLTLVVRPDTGRDTSPPPHPSGTPPT